MMTRTIPQEGFSEELLAILEETFEAHHGIYLDKGTSLFVIFYLDFLERTITGQDVGKTDWGEIWNRASEVSVAEWDVIRARLRETYDRISKTLRAIENWERNNAIGDSMAIVVHTAYHLGEIRQALCTVV